MPTAVERVVRVLVIDRQPVYRRGVVEVLRLEAGLDVVGDTDDVVLALENLDDFRPDVVLLDLAVLGGGIVACAQLRELRPDLAVVVLADAEDDTDLAGAVRAGARGYLLKDTTPVELVDAVRMVAAGQTLLSPAMAARMLDQFAVFMRASQSSAEGTSALSRRELEVLNLVAQGLGNRSIAESLFISENTVKNHIRSIHEKLQVHSRMEAVVRAVRDGVLRIA